MKVLCILAWIGVCGGCALGGLVILGGMGTAKSAPQEAVVVCLGLACAILPYCFARALTEMYQLDQVSQAVRDLKQEVPVHRAPEPSEEIPKPVERASPYNHESLSILK